jgi:hypothetical protein
VNINADQDVDVVTQNIRDSLDAPVAAAAGDGSKKKWF